MVYQHFEVSILDEIRGIPCGQRVVEAEVGRKWVRVRQPGRTSHRIEARVWGGLAPKPVAVKRRKGRR